MPDVYVEAEYEDGYIHRQDDEDRSRYVEHKNIFDDILHRRPEAEHGRTVRFSLTVPGARYDVPFDRLPDNTRPVRWLHMERVQTADGAMRDSQIVGIDFGYQYTDDEGRNIQKVIAVK